MKALLRCLIVLVALLPVAAGAAYLWLLSAVPDYDGTLRVPSLRAPVQVMRDRNAVPHIFAANDADAYFALGYVHAQDRLWQMEMQRRIGAGRLAELRFSAARLPLDRLFRTLGFYRDAEASYHRLPPEVKAALDAYAAGVNAWIENHRGSLPPEFLVLGIEPEPWRPADSLVWGRLIAFQLSANYRTEILRSRLAASLGPEKLADLFPPGVGTFPSSLAGLWPPDTIERLAGLPPPIGPATASNEWVLAGDRTVTGKPILVNDPHLGLSVPILWYLARIETPTLSVTGATVPGVPFTVLGHNRSIAWGFTTTGSDVQDLFVERVDPAAPDRYLTPQGSEPFETRDEVIRVHGSEPVPLRIRRTRHGPVISDVSTAAGTVAGEGEVVSLAFTAITPEDTIAEAIYRLNRAADWDEFRAAMAAWRAPQQNVVYADADGNIGFFVPGDLPIRKSGNGQQPVPGWTGEYDWVGTVPFDELPQAFNPPSGRIVNANNAVAGPEYPHLIALEYDEPFRAARIEELLDRSPPQSVESSQEMLMDKVSLAAAELLPVMLDIRADDARSADVLASLRRWDFSMDRDLREPLIFSAWLRSLGPALYGDELGELSDAYSGWRPAVVKRMLTERQAWCDDVRTAPVESCEDALRASFATALAFLEAAYGPAPADWRWGDAHVAPLKHPVFGSVPLLGRLVDLSAETDGGQYTVNRGAMDVDAPRFPFAHVHGAGYRAVYDLSDLGNSRFIIATGQSGHPLSSFYGNLVEPWRNGRFLELPRDPEELIRNGLGTLILRPAGANGK
jgi:penicillin amidase